MSLLASLKNMPGFQSGPLNPYAGANTYHGVINKNPDGSYSEGGNQSYGGSLYGTDNYGNPFQSAAQADAYAAADAARMKNLDSWQEQAKTQQATGPFDPRSLSDNDKYYLMAMAQQMNFDPRYLMKGDWYGSDVADVGSQRWQGGGPADDLFNLESKINPELLKAIKGIASNDSNYTKYFPGAYSTVGQGSYRGADWLQGWNRAHQGGNVYGNGTVIRNQGAWNQIGGPNGGPTASGPKPVTPPTISPPVGTDTTKGMGGPLPPMGIGATVGATPFTPLPPSGLSTNGGFDTSMGHMQPLNTGKAWTINPNQFRGS